MTPIFNPKNNCYYKELQGLTAGFGPAFLFNLVGCLTPGTYSVFLTIVC